MNETSTEFFGEFFVAFLEKASIGEVPSETTYGAFASVVRRHGVGGLLHGLPTRSVLHAVVWCVVGAGREACERFGLRDTWSEHFLGRFLICTEIFFCWA